MSQPEIKLCCPHCGGAVWRSESIYRPDPDGLKYTHVFTCTCDACAKRREKVDESVAEKNCIDWRGMYHQVNDFMETLYKALKDERAAHEKTTKELENRIKMMETRQ